MQQKDVRGLFVIHIETLKNWERNACTPSVRHFPAIIRFLGYVRFDHDGTPGGQLAFLRKCAGMTQKEVARLTGIDVVSLWRYERNRQGPDKRFRELCAELVTAAKVPRLGGRWEQPF